jgi:hypothetical protein
VRRTPGLRLAAFGLVAGLLGVVAYFVVVLRFAAWLPEVRNDALPNWAIVLVGLALALAGARRALAAPRGTRRRWLPPALAGVDVALTAFFAWIMFGVSAVPAFQGPAIGAPAPDFVLTAQDGRRVGLADFRGRPLLLVFYRGHW